MAQEFSFDIVSECNMQMVDDAVNVTVKEINNRFDLKSQNIVIEFNRTEKTITITAPSEFVVKQAKDILLAKMSKREISHKALTVKKTEKAAKDSVREISSIISGIEQELAKTIVKDIKALNLKVQSAIQEDKIRVSAKVKDDLQKVIHFVREKDYPIPLQFTNYR